MTTITIRQELAQDINDIAAVVNAAFAQATHKSGQEAAIVSQLRIDNALSISLVALDGDGLIGHVAFSKVKLNDQETDWYGLGPVAVLPLWQRRGVGKKLIKTGLQMLQEQEAAGCVVLGDPAYYQPFGFASDNAMRLADVPAGFFQVMPMAGEVIEATVTYHPAFSIS